MICTVTSTKHERIRNLNTPQVVSSYENRYNLKNMRIALVSTLFPPDVDETAQYTKELAGRLTAADQVTLLVYGFLPESIANASIIAVDKRRNLPLRLGQMWYQLMKAARVHDILIIENGPSIELPALLTTFLSRTPIIFLVSDARAQEQSKRHPLFSFLYQSLQKRSKRTFNIAATLPSLERPLVHPLHPYPTTAMESYEQAWATHTTELQQHLKNHGTKK